MSHAGPNMEYRNPSGETPLERIVERQGVQEGGARHVGGVRR